MSVPAISTPRPVGTKPAYMPVCVPIADQRVVTRSFSAIWSSIKIASSPNASWSARMPAMYPARSIVAPAESCPTKSGAISSSSTSSAGR